MRFDQVGHALSQWFAEHGISERNVMVMLRCTDHKQEDQLKSAIAHEFSQVTYGPAPNPQFAKFECYGVQFVVTNLDASARMT